MERTQSKLALAKASVRELKDKIKTAKERRDYFVRYLQELWQDYRQGKVSKEFCIETEYKKLDGKTIREWIAYYDNYIRHCESLIKHHKKHIAKRHFLTLFFSVIIIVLIAFLFSNYFQVLFTGLPIAQPGGETDLRAQACGRQDLQTTQNTFDLACAGTFPSSCGGTGDTLSCDDSAFEWGRASKSGATISWGGVNISSYNSSITDCNSITQVKLCYKFWNTDGVNLGQVECRYGVDANGGASWTDSVVSCVGSEPGSADCIDVTANETWTCSNFFGASGTRALAKTQVQRTGGSGAANFTFDVLFFNVTYTTAGADPVAEFGINPADNINRSNSSVTFDLRGYDETALSYLRLYGNWTGSWVANQTNTSPINATYWNVTVDAIPDGKWIWAAWVNDTSNNQDFTDTNRTFTIDTVAPVISLPFYVNGTKQTSTSDTLTLNISVTDATTNPSACKIDINGTNQTVAISSGWCNITNGFLTDLADGNRTINVYANDSTGQFGLNNSFVVFMDSNAPVPQFGVNPADNVNRSNTSVTFELRAYDGIEVNYLNLYGNWTGSWVVNQSNSSPINDTFWNITVDNIPQGKFIWAAWANDSHNNQAFTATNRTFTIDTVAPTITLPFYANGTQKFNNETLTLNVSVSDATTNPSACKIEVNGTNTTVAFSSGWCNTTSIPLTDLAAGNRTINVYANDSVNNFGLNNSFVVDILASNAAPTIPFVQAIADQNATEASYTGVVFNFSVNDTDGSSNINISSVRAQFNQTGEATRSNTSCVNISSGGNGIMFTCNVSIWYFDNSGVWTINVSARDNSEASVSNTTTNFTYNLLTAMVISPTALTWPSPINLTDTNVSSDNDPITINNTGNALNLSINTTAYNLRGETDTGKFIFANNFTIGNVTDGCGAGINASIMQNATSLKVNGTNLSRGNNSLNFGNETSGQEQLFFCLRGVPQDITEQSYSSSFYGPWTITVLLVAIIPAGRRKKKEKKERVAENKLIESLDLLEYLNIVDKLKEQYHLSKEEIMRTVIEKAGKKYNIDRKDLLEIIKAREGITIPVTIFSKDLGALESVVKYMKENLRMSYSEIAKALSRDERTIWTAYKKANEKQKEPLKIKEPKIVVPLSAFENKELTILESIIIYLKQKGFNFKEIADILERDQRNIWTVYSRAKKKGKGTTQI